MNIEQRIKKPLPFYMTHPGYFGPGKENTVLRDLEYLQQTYPLEVRKYQRRVAEILDKMDYEGSMIYDEYPDRYSLMRLTKSIVKILQNENGETEEASKSFPEKWTWLENLIQVLVCGEIYKRRHGGSLSFFSL